MGASRASRRHKPAKPAAVQRARSGAPVNRRRLLAISALCLIHFLLAVTSVRQKSNTYDEIAHLTRGYSYFLTGDFRLGPPHPPLAHYWAALPGLGKNVKFPPKLVAEEHLGDWRQSDMWAIGRQFFYYAKIGNAEIIDALLFRGRAMIALWSVGLGLVTYFWARRLFGAGGGLLALALYAFSPTMLAHGRLVTTDLAAALFFISSLAAVWWLLHHLRPLSVLAGALALACLFLSKMSAVIIIPVGLGLLVLRLIRGDPLPLSWRGQRREIRGRPALLGCFLAVMVFWIATTYTAIWAAYGFRYSAMVNPDPEKEHLYTNLAIPPGKTLWEHVLRDSPEAPISDSFKRAIHWLRDHRVFPEAYLYSAAYSRQTARGRQSFLDGRTDILGFRSFFPKAFLYKTPLPLMGLLVVAAVTPFVRRTQTRATAAPTPPAPARSVWRFLYDTAPLTVFFAIYWYLSTRSQLNIGHRHILPTYPVLFIFCGAGALLWESGHRILRALPLALLALFIGASLLAYPNYLAYFNLIAGGPSRGYRHLVDSSLDWGQDLPGLRDYLARRRAEGFGGDAFVSYFGSGGDRALAHFQVRAEPLASSWPEGDGIDPRLRPGLYALSATNLQQVYSRLHDWTAEREAEYQKLRPQFDAAVSAGANSAAPPTPAARAALSRFIKLRFARLCAYLRAREPDDMVNYSILIYDLDQAELDAALQSPVPE